MEQGIRSFFEFLSEVEDQEHLCRMEEMNLISMDMQRMIMIAGGMRDRMAENTIAEKYSLKQVIITNIHRVEEKLFQGGDMDQLFPGRAGGCNEVRKRGKCSDRSTHEDSKGDKCKKCTYNLGDGRCPSDGRK